MKYLTIMLLCACALPRGPISVERVTVCINVESSPGAAWKKPTKGAQACAEFAPQEPAE